MKDRTRSRMHKGVQRLGPGGALLRTATLSGPGGEGPRPEQAPTNRTNKLLPDTARGP